MTSPHRPLRLAIDATPLLGPRTGIGEFCSHLLTGLAGRPGLEVGAFAVSRVGRTGLTPLLPPGVAARGHRGPGLPARALHRMWAVAALPTAEMLWGDSDVVHGTNFVVPPARAATVVTVHDLSPLHNPEWAPPAARRYPALVRAAVRRGAWVHADSEHVAREVVELLGVPAERVRAVHLGVSSPAGPPPNEPGTGDELRGRLATVLPDWVTSYVLGLSRVEPRKDFPTLVRAFGQIAAAHPGLALVLAGPDGLGSARLGQAVADCPAADRVVRLGWVDDGLKEALVAGATVFAYPSVYEGFGLPPLEAMAMGTPVVATRAGALPEVLGDAARLVAVGDGTALAAALGELVDDPAARLELSNRGRRRAAQFTWASCADGLVALYEQAAYEQAARAARGG